jgi:uncharacterized membrane protein (GlpM family)
MKSKSKIITGSILILAGVSTLIENFNLINESFVLPVLGAAFLFFYFMLGARKKYGNIGFLIPGIILPALQLLEYVDNSKVGEEAEIAVVFGVLSISFLAIYLIHTYWFKEVSKGQRNWPLYVSIIVFLFGTAVFAIEIFNWKFGMVFVNNMWPAVLVIVGGRMLFKAIKENKEKII